MLTLHLDFDVAPSRQTQVGEAVDRFGCRVADVDKAFVDTHFKLLASLFVHMRAFDHGEGAAVGWQRDWPGDGCASAQCSVHDLLRSLVDHSVVIGLQTNTYSRFLFFFRFCNHGSSFVRCRNLVREWLPSSSRHRLYITNVSIACHCQKVNFCVIVVPRHAGIYT